MTKKREITVWLLFAAMIGICCLLLSGIEHQGRSAETSLVRDAVQKAALTCYAVEGAYPEDLKYLRDHYGLAYDANKYIVSYDAFASNLMPQINVLEKGEKTP